VFALMLLAVLVGSGSIIEVAITCLALSPPIPEFRSAMTAGR
jgi:hypothetical protein